MGSEQSQMTQVEKKTTKVEKKQILEETKIQVKESISATQSQILRNNNMSEQQIVQAIVLTEKCKSQLDRDGLALTKDDLVAIIIALDMKYASQIQKIRTNTVVELNAIIRLIIYNPSRLQMPERLLSAPTSGTNPRGSSGTNPSGTVAPRGTSGTKTFESNPKTSQLQITNSQLRLQ